MTDDNDDERRGTRPPYEIRERTFRFATRTVRLVRQFPPTVDAIEVGRQLVRAATSVGANVEEAHGAESKRDFVHEMSIACKEAREARYWLRLVKSAINHNGESESLLKESDEIVRVLSTIVARSRQNDWSFGWLCSAHIEPLPFDMSDLIFAT